MSKRLFDHDQELEIVRLYGEGIGAPTLARERHTNTRTIYNILKRHGVALRPRDAIPPETRQAIIEACRGGMSAAEASRVHVVGKTSVLEMLAAANVVLQQGGHAIHSLRHDAFDVLTPEALYWIGFIFADGGTYDEVGHAPRLVVTVSDKDREHLVKLKRFLHATHKLTQHHTATQKGGPSVSLGPRSVTLVARLRAYGLTIKPERVATEALTASRDFWRGVVDGDGSLGRTSKYAQVLLCGHRPLLEQYRGFLLRCLGGKAPNIVPQRGIWQCSTTGAPAERIIAILYADCSVALDRKNQRAQAIIAGDTRRSLPYESGRVPKNQPA